MALEDVVLLWICTIVPSALSIVGSVAIILTYVTFQNLRKSFTFRVGPWATFRDLAPPITCASVNQLMQ
jgi:hypothetical protein